MLLTKKENPHQSKDIYVITKLSPAQKAELRAYARALGCPSPVKRAIIWTLLAIFIVSDWTSANLYTQILFNESPLIGLLTSFVIASIMDGSMYFLGLRLNTIVTDAESRRRRRWACAGLALSCLMAFGVMVAFCLLANETQTSFQGLSGTITVSAGNGAFYPRLALAFATNALSIVLGVADGPKQEEINRLLIQRKRTVMLRDANKILREKYSQDQEVFSADRYDLEKAKVVLLQLRTATEIAAQKARALLAQEVGTDEAARALLTDLSDEAFWQKAEAKLHIRLAPAGEAIQLEAAQADETQNETNQADEANNEAKATF